MWCTAAGPNTIPQPMDLAGRWCSLGSIRVLTDSTGAAIGSVRTSSGFSGEQTDSESGLLSLRARYLDPTTGRFLSKDPANSG